MSDQPDHGKRKSGDLQRAVRSQVLEAMRHVEPAQLALTQGALDYLATRASTRILRDLGRRKVGEGVAAAEGNLPEVIEKLQKSESGQAELPPKFAQLNQRSVVRMVELDEICGVFPFC